MTNHSTLLAILALAALAAFAVAEGNQDLALVCAGAIAGVLTPRSA